MKLLTYAKRLAPFAVLFLSLQLIMRVILLNLESDHIENVVQVASVLGMGAIFDSAVFCFFLIPITLLFSLIPARAYGKLSERIVSTALLFGMTSFWLFGLVSEWFFWEEFQTRFNFIAVDYLVYTHEVIGNIKESYPIPLLIIGIASLSTVISMIYYFFIYSFFHKNMTPSNSIDNKAVIDTSETVVEEKRSSIPLRTARVRLSSIAAGVMLSVVAYHVMDSRYAQVTENRYLNEIAKNGVYELFSAFKNNELPFESFYRTASNEETAQRLKSKLKIEASQQHPLIRFIQGRGEEKHWNVVMITVESLSASYLKEFGNTDNVTPYLDEIAENALFFTNLYAIGTRTVFGLAGLTLSIPPLPGNSIVRRPDNDNLFTLGTVFDHKGYDVKFIYGGYGYFDNMNAFFAANHYKIVDRTDVDKSKVTHANVWGIADEDLLNRVIEESDKSYAQGKPFFQMVMTTSNHRPFTYPEGRIDIPSHTSRNGAVKYTDYAIGHFIKAAQSKPWFDNTVFVIVADHTAGSAGKIELDPNKYHIPLIIYAPKLIEAQKVGTMASQIDVAPTLLGLMNMSYTSQFFGHDIVTATTERAFISNYLQLGYMTPDGLVVLKPKKEIAFYKKVEGEFVVDAQTNEPLLNEALSYYQTAAQWKALNKLSS